MMATGLVLTGVGCKFIKRDIDNHKEYWSERSKLEKMNVRVKDDHQYITSWDGTVEHTHTISLEFLEEDMSKVEHDEIKKQWERVTKCFYQYKNGGPGIVEGFALSGAFLFLTLGWTIFNFEK